VVYNNLPDGMKLAGFVPILLSCSASSSNVAMQN